MSKVKLDPKVKSIKEIRNTRNVCIDRKNPTEQLAADKSGSPAQFMRFDKADKLEGF